MQKLKLCAAHMKNPRKELEYYFLMKGGMCGIEIRDTHSGETAVRFVPDNVEKVYKFLLRLARNTVTPIHLDDVIDDYIYERWYSKRSLYFLQAGPCAGFDRGKRNAEPFGNLLTGVAADEG